MLPKFSSSSACHHPLFILFPIRSDRADKKKRSGGAILGFLHGTGLALSGDLPM